MLPSSLKKKFQSDAGILMELQYGHKTITLRLPNGQSYEVLENVGEEPLADPEKSLLEALRSPIASPPLKEVVRAGETVCLLVNDSTRLARSEFFLPLLIDELAQAGISKDAIFIIFANGTHRPLDPAEMNNLVGERVAKKIAMFNHDSRNYEELSCLGETSYKTPVYINNKVLHADRRILTGSVVHHYFAGYGGGRKALVPGVAGWETIKKNHSLMFDERACSGRLDGNPVHEDLLEAALMVGGDFLLNTVLDENKDILGFFAGNMIKAHLAACHMADRVYGVEIDRLADVVIASCGGYPKDINLYQAHKTLDHAMKAVKKGGDVILLAKCSEGIGSEAYKDWINKCMPLPEMEEMLRSEFALGGHKAYTVGQLLQQGRVHLVSDLDPEEARLFGFTPASSLEAAVAEIYQKRKDLLTYIILQGSIVLPRHKKR